MVSRITFSILRETEIDRRKATFTIIPYVNDPCQVRHSSLYFRYWIASTPFFSHQIHANCRALHNYSLHEKKKAAQREGPSFDGALNNFPVPQLSSLAKLVGILSFGYRDPLMECYDQNMDETLPL